MRRFLLLLTCILGCTDDDGASTLTPQGMYLASIGNLDNECMVPNLGFAPASWTYSQQGDAMTIDVLAAEGANLDMLFGRHTFTGTVSTSPEQHLQLVGDVVFDRNGCMHTYDARLYMTPVQERGPNYWLVGQIDYALIGTSTPCSPCMSRQNFQAMYQH